jgi:hypothetical protein
MAYKGYPAEHIPVVLEYDEKELLRQNGVWTTTNRVLKRTCKLSARTRLSQKTGIPSWRLLDLANCADLLRVKGLGSDYIRLLRACRVRTLKELRAKNPKAFHKKLLDYNKIHSVVTFAPSLYHVTAWVESAKLLEPKISYK